MMTAAINQSINQSINRFTSSVCNVLCPPAKIEQVRQPIEATATVQHGTNLTVPGVLMSTNSGPLEQSRAAVPASSSINANMMT